MDLQAGLTCGLAETLKDSNNRTRTIPWPK